MARSKHVALVMVPGEYARGVIQGIFKYPPAADWRMRLIDAESVGVGNLRRENPDGILAGICSPEHATLLAGLYVRCVNVRRDPAQWNVARVIADDRNIGELAAAHFLEHGSTRFAFAGSAGSEESRLRQDGFVERLGRNDFREVATWMGTAGENTGLADWIAGLVKPVAIFAATDEIARQIVEVCDRVGARLPKDVALLGCGNDAILCHLTMPKLSSVILPAERIGYEAASALERLMDGKKLPQPTVELPMASVVGRGSSDVVTVSDPQVAAALRFILAHAGEWVGVRELLLAVPTQRRTLERKFQKELGRSPLEEIRRVRLDLAREMLAGSDLPIQIVSRRAGFSGPKQLSTVMRAEMGMTPSAYRAKFRVLTEDSPEESA